jgi:hypothetical protein
MGIPGCAIGLRVELEVEWIIQMRLVDSGTGHYLALVPRREDDFDSVH